MKKKLNNFLLLFLVVCSTSILAQNNSVGIGTTIPDNSAILDLVSNNQGLLIPRNNTSGITSIASPSDGLILYNTDDKCYWFWNNSSWKRLCETDSLLTLINNLGDTIGFIYDSLAVHNTNIFNNTTNINNLYDSVDVINNSITNLTTIINNHSDSIGWIYDSLAVHNTNIFNNTTNINNLYDSLAVYNNYISNLTTIVNNHSDSLGWIYDSLAVHNTNIFNNTTNINNLYDSLTVYNNLVTINTTNIINNTTNIQNLSDSLGWVYDSLAVYNNLVNTNITNITTNTTNINNLYDSINVINTHLGVVDSTLLNKWDIYGNTGTNPTNNFLGTIDNQDLVFRTINTEKVRVTTTGRLGIGTNAPTELLDINSNALRLRTGATNNYILTTDATGVGTWQDPSLNPILTTYITTTTAPLGNDWKLLGNSGTNASTNFIGTTDTIDFVLRTNNVERGRFKQDGSLLLNGSSGTTPVSGGGTRLMWIPNKGAFRAGVVLGTEWDDVNIGQFSAAFGDRNISSAFYSFVVGFSNTVSGIASFASGANNTVTSASAFASGSSNNVSGYSSGVFGSSNSLSSQESFICGTTNTMSVLAASSIIIGANNSSTAGNTAIFGNLNQISNRNSAALGLSNNVSGDNSFALGGSNTASAPQSIVIGYNSTSSHQLSLVTGQTSSTNNFQYSGGFANGYQLYTNFASTLGATLPAGSGTWASISDVNKKTNITDLDYTDVLKKINTLEIKKWSYIGQTVSGQDKEGVIIDEKGNKVKVQKDNLYEKDIYHIGVMAQDFYKEFGLGTSETLITTLDVAGVNMAAIKALIKENEILKVEIQSIKEQLINLQK